MCFPTVQAAAHGVPTVATKNGGPVDIMQTLHSGLLVDPTDSKEIAEACLNILTRPETWDSMSANGWDPFLMSLYSIHALKRSAIERRFAFKRSATVVSQTTRDVEAEYRC